MRFSVAFGTLLTLFTLAACETANTTTNMKDFHPTVMVQRDASYRLTETERQQIRRGFDMEALERLLSHVRPEQRDSLLAAFRIPRSGEAFQELWYLGDPGLQEILEEVWAPVWEHRTVEEIEADETDRPGKRLAIARRQRGHS
ncbi:MAG TPA: hypothetical protein VF746_30545 [Longimicrobium sp.]|jgi:hypothetical protein